jgi:hypothetical protein
MVPTRRIPSCALSFFSFFGRHEERRLAVVIVDVLLCRIHRRSTSHIHILQLKRMTDGCGCYRTSLYIFSMGLIGCLQGEQQAKDRLITEAYNRGAGGSHVVKVGNTGAMTLNLAAADLYLSEIQ